MDSIVGDFERRIVSQEITSYDGDFIWKITDYARRFEDALSGREFSLYSPAFYTSRHGYKVGAKVYLNGDGIGSGTHMSLFFVVMKGEFDALLTWPFQQKVRFSLLNQVTKGVNIWETYRADPHSSSFQKPTSERNVASGSPLFVSLNTLRAPTDFLKDDSLYIRVTVLKT